MADNQLAIARQSRGVSTHLSKSARKVVPRFLQKLYEIVNDPDTDELIRWNDIGDSFFILDSTRLAKEVFEKWFKHNNFSSFVRQLNMYGFHKIPLLQQGVLRSDTDTELWNFEHPHFRRGQPDMLCLIQRKKQPNAPNARVPEEQPIIPPPQDPVNTVPQTPLPALPTGQVLDVNSLVNGISAIKRHQQAISADLNELKTSNQHLWQEAMAARERHKKHQDTINRILKFLAGVFGHSTGSPVHKHDGSESPHPVVPRKRQRLMIVDAGGDKSKGASVADEDEEDYDMSGMDAPTPTSQFASIRTPSDLFSPDQTPSAIPEDPIASTQSQNESSPTVVAPSALTSFNPSRKGGANSADLLQSAFSQMMSSPEQFQRLLQALSQNNFPIQPPPAPADFSTPSESRPNNQLTTYAPPLNFEPSPEAYNAHSSMVLPFSDSHEDEQNRSANGLPLSQVDSLGPHFQEHEAQLQKSWKDATQIAASVDLMDTNIKSFIEDLGGFDSSIFTQPEAGGSNLSGDGGKSSNQAAGSGTFESGVNDGGDLNFAFDDFFPQFSQTADNQINYEDLSNHLASSAAIADGETDQLSAFLDDVASDTVSIRQHSPEAPLSKRKKRKSDVTDILNDFDQSMTSEPTQKLAKRTK